MVYFKNIKKIVVSFHLIAIVDFHYDLFYSYSMSLNSPFYFRLIILLAMVAKAFDDGGIKWDFVINLAGETKYSQTEEVRKFFY